MPLDLPSAGLSFTTGVCGFGFDIHQIKTELIRGYCTQPLRFSCNQRQWPPYPRAPRLGPRPFSISLVNLFGGNFVRRPTQWIAHPAARLTHYAPRCGGYCAQPLHLRSRYKQASPPSSGCTVQSQGVKSWGGRFI